MKKLRVEYVPFHSIYNNDGGGGEWERYEVEIAFNLLGQGCRGPP